MVSSTGTFVSCKDYDDDIDAINKELTDLKSKLSDLETKVNAGGAYVTKIESVDGGFKVSVSDGTSYNLTVASAAAGSKVVIDDKTGEISIDDKATGWFATTGEREGAVDMTPYVEDGYWYLYDKTAKEFVKSEYKAAGNAYAVVKDDVLTLHMPDESGKMQSIVLPLTANALTAVTVPAALTFCSTNATANSPIVWGVAGAKNDNWKGPKGKYAKDQLLIGQISPATVGVSPVSYDLSAQKLTLVDSKGVVAPVNVIATAVADFDEAISGNRAASKSGNWNLSIAMNEDVTDENIDEVFGGAASSSSMTKVTLYALCVNGVPYTNYDIAIKVKNAVTASSAAAITYNNANLTYFDAEGNSVAATGSGSQEIALPLGKTTLTYTEEKLYDSYFTFENTYTDKAAALGVVADGMTITVPEQAAGQELVATLHMADVAGTVTTKDITLKLAGAVVDPDQELAAVDYEVMPALKEILVPVSEMWTKMTAAEVEKVDALSQLVLTDSETTSTFLADDLTINGNSGKVKFYAANADGTVNNTTALTDNDITGASGSARKIAWMGITVASNVNTAAKAGSYKLNLAVKDDKGNEIKKFTVPVNVTLPAFDKLYSKVGGDVWSENTCTLRMGYNANGATLDMTHIFKAATTATVANAVYTFGDKMLNSADDGVTNKTNGSTSTVVLNNAKIQDATTKALTTKELKFTVSYTIGGANKLVVTSPEYTVKMMTIFEGAELKFYKAGKAVATAEYAFVTDAYKIAKDNEASNNTRAGLALTYKAVSKPVSTTLISASDFSRTATISNIELSSYASAAPDELAEVKVTTSTDLNGVTPTITTEGITLTSLAETNSGTLTLTFTDANGFVTTSAIPFKLAE